MIEQKYSITRTRATWKPRIIDSDLPFFRCDTCGYVYLGFTGNKQACFTGTGRTLVAEPPYARDMQQAPPCCNTSMQRMEYRELDALPKEISLNYRILGGFNSNAIECSWRLESDRYAVSWIALKTFTGSQMKYIMPGKKSPLIFALSDEDAYVYCDESPCLECTFMCKRGFVLYAGIQDTEERVSGTAHEDGAEAAPLTSFIARMPLTRMSPYWESRP